jgi:hypothetical protein
MVERIPQRGMIEQVPPGGTIERLINRDITSNNFDNFQQAT